MTPQLTIDALREMRFSGMAAVDHDDLAVGRGNNKAVANRIGNGFQHMNHILHFSVFYSLYLLFNSAITTSGLLFRRMGITLLPMPRLTIIAVLLSV